MTTSRTTTRPGYQPAGAAPARSVDVTRFPWPLSAQHYRYSTNVEPAGVPVTTAAGGWGAERLVIDEHYRDDLDLRAQILAADPSRSTCLPHMLPAAWDALLWVLAELARTDPGHMRLQRVDASADRPVHRWRNDVLGTDVTFGYGRQEDLGTDPLTFLGTQIQEDIVLLDQREDHLWVDAGCVTFAADWSLGFDTGMGFLDVHGPVPRVHAEGVIPRAETFMMRLIPGADYRRTNFSLTADARLDTSAETYPQWGSAKRDVVAAWHANGDLDQVGQRLYLRVEVQHLVRLPMSGAVMFLIRTHLMSLRDLAGVAQWRRQFRAVLADLPADMADYKGLTAIRPAVLAWLDGPGAALAADD
ncbi:DUF3445 domain-containing protein [Gordonia jinhuaensis]|uniref:DUF3445 domain-containing protein n=1 Tax=Gordonia jinhuaensis TaxID=1517702 RepID=A0A916THR3_9ACTN|nr:DUF3445 domain-containing protein [Gordonia jinhuaensis]GGB45650.1 hypothetical protein GCM10011489_36340 [Gordonia jinhuaensis]